MVMDENLFSKENKYKKMQRSNVIVDEFGERQILIGVLERVSTDTQAVDGDSLEMQREMAQDYANSIGGIIYKFYTEEGVSASKVRLEKREKVQQLIQDIKDNKVNYVIAYKRDRMFRNTQEYMWFIQFLADNNCEIYLTARGEQQIDLSAFKTAGASKMMEVVMSMVAEMESATTSARVSDTMISKAQKGEFTGGSVPIGYKLENGKYVPIKGAKSIFEKIEDLYLQGYGMMTIAKWLNGAEIKNLPTLTLPIPKPISYSSTELWNHRNINTILFNPVYTGHLQYQSKKNIDLDRIIEKSDMIIPLRTEERQRDINLLQAKKKKGVRPPRAYNTTFLLSGLLFCDECGEKFLTSTTQDKEGKRRSYYVCKNKRSNYKNTHCNNHGYRKEVIEDLILKAAKDKIAEFLSPNVYEKLKAKIELDKLTYSKQSDNVEKRIEALQEELNNYTELVGQLKDDFELQKVYLQKQKQILIELNDMKEAYAVLAEKSEGESKDFNLEDFMRLATNFGDVVENAPVGIQKQLLEDLFTDIYVNKEGNVSLKIRAGLADNSNILDDADSNDDSEASISFSTGRSPVVVKGRQQRINEFEIEFNYFDFVYEITSMLYKNLEDYLSSFDKNILIENAHAIDLITLPDYKNRAYKDDFIIRKAINAQYLITHYGLNYYSLTKYREKTGLSLKTIKSMIDTSGGSFEEYLEYLLDIYPNMIVDEELLGVCINISNERDKIYDEALFKGKIRCKCGKLYVRKKSIHTSRYVCPNKKNCRTIGIKELELIEKIKVDTGYIIKSYKDVENLIEGIQVYNERKKYKVFYNDSNTN